MFISKLAIKRGVTFTMIYLILVGFGIFGLSQLKLDLYPNVQFPVIAVFSTYQGVGPEDIENSLTRPLERAIISVENIKHVTSYSTAGNSVLILEFDWGTDMKKAENDVRKSIDLVRDYLPDEASDPVAFAFDPSLMPIMFVTLSSEKLGDVELKEIAEDQITPRIERIPGVAAADIRGGMEREIKILFNPVKMAALGISVQNLIQKLQLENLQIPAGIIDNKEQEFTVRAYGEYTNIKQIENTVVGYKNRKPIYLKEIASIVDGYKEKRDVVRNNGKNAVTIVIRKQSDANTVQTARLTRKELPKILSVVGGDIKYDIIFDSSKFITRSINNLTSTAIQAFVLAFLVILFFLRNVRSSLIVSVSIPISLLVTFFVMNQAGITLNIISMAGLALAIGMLVDNSIVVLENIFRHKEFGQDAFSAADDGTSEVANAIIASTLTTLAIFVPILFVPGIAGVMFKDMVVTIVLSLTTSLIVALTLIPLLSSRLLQSEAKKRKTKIFNTLNKSIENFLERLELWYVRTLDFFMGRKKLFLGIIVVLAIVTVFISRFVGGEFLPKTDQSQIEINIEREPGVSLTAMDSTVREIERMIKDEIPEAKNIFTSFGTGEGIVAIFGTGASNEGEIRIDLPDVKERDRSVFEMEDILREKLKNIPGLKFTFSEGGNMFGTSGDIQIKIFGYNRQMTEALANRVEKELKKIKGIVDITKSFKIPRPEYKIVFDREKIYSMGLSVFQISSIIEAQLKGKVATIYRKEGKEYDITVQADETFRNSKSDIENIYIPTLTGIQIPLKSIAKVVLADAPQRIIREDQERMVTITCDVSGRDLRSAVNDIMKVMKKIPFPQDFRWEIGGTAKDQQESFMYLGLALLAAIVLVYMVMASQFESLIDPFIIMFTVPLALMGVIWMLLITGTTLSITALIGMVLLVGIVVNNGIVLIDYINQQREKHGKHLWEAILIGGRRRMRPILMTALTTILSMVPLALKLGSGAEIWSPLARAVIGGLTVSTFLTLIMVPLIYLYFEQISLRRKVKKGLADPSELERPAGLVVEKIR